MYDAQGGKTTKILDYVDMSDFYDKGYASLYAVTGRGRYVFMGEVGEERDIIENVAYLNSKGDIVDKEYVENLSSPNKYTSPYSWESEEGTEYSLLCDSEDVIHTDIRFHNPSVIFNDYFLAKSQLMDWSDFEGFYNLPWTLYHIEKQ